VLGTFQGNVDTAPYHVRRLLKSTVVWSYFVAGDISRSRAINFRSGSVCTGLQRTASTARAHRVEAAHASLAQRFVAMVRSF
jgi:hypothetical protein